jgi:hypothetical protein
MNSRAESMIREVMASDTYRSAVATLTAEHDRTVDDIITLTQIAAPSFKEETRAQAFRAMAEAHGLKNVEIDAEGNVTGMRPGIGNGPLICVAAHLDTVFPAGTELTVRREGTRLFAPGVGDDTRSLAVLLAWLRAMCARAPTCCSSPMSVRKAQAICAACGTCSNAALTRIASARSSRWTAQTWSTSPWAALAPSATASPSRDLAGTATARSDW